VVRAPSLGEPVAEEDVVWGDLPIHAAYYVTSEPPPEELVTSVRAVVLCGERVLVSRNRDAVLHALPGGRREAGESFEETLRREVLEETGYAIDRPRRLGVAHLRHLAPKPAGYRFPHPDFLWAVYVVESDGQRLGVPADDYELEARFVSLAEAPSLVDLPSRVYLEAVWGSRAE
jgi:8-oxo-dGTP pyrophosphatase MutT (NUDIX family)